MVDVLDKSPVDASAVKARRFGLIVIGDEINYYHFMVVRLWWEGKE